MLFVAQSKLFRARWSEQIHDEWVSNLLQNRPDLKPEDLSKTRSSMNNAVPDCLVSGYESLMEGISLPDPNDRHVIAAAVLTRASVIVTFNEKDFPAETLNNYRLKAVHPDAFLLDLFSLDPDSFAEAVITDFEHYRSPPLTFDSYLESLKKAGVPELVDALRPLAILMSAQPE